MKRARRSSLAVAQERNELLAARIRTTFLEAQLAAAERIYDAAKITSQRPKRGNAHSGDANMQHARGRLREVARYLDENHDLAVGVLNDLVANVVGNGINLEPQIKRADGALHDEMNADVQKLWEDWVETPEVTAELSWGQTQAIAALSWFRDGEVFAQHVTTDKLDHRTKVPYSIELIEADMCPFDLVERDTNTRHGVQKDAWGRPLAYHFYLRHPGDVLATDGGAGRLTLSLETKKIVAERVVHVKFVRRIKQTRGVTVLHAALTRLDDIRDYEESERIAARVAAAMCGYIKRSADYSGVNVNASGDRTFEMAPGMVFDTLLPGEDVGMLSANRPNTGLADFRASMLRAVAAGTGSRYSAISRDYNGTYSAQRQELVEGRMYYGQLTAAFIERFVKPIYYRFLEQAVLTGALRIRPGADKTTLYDCDARGPAMPWIDPLKEIKAGVEANEAGLKSRQQIIRDSGGDPKQTFAQLAQEADLEIFAPVKPAPAPAGEPPGEPEADDDAPAKPAEDRSVQVNLHVAQSPAAAPDVKVDVRAGDVHVAAAEPAQVHVAAPHVSVEPQITVAEDPP